MWYDVRKEWKAKKKMKRLENQTVQMWTHSFPLEDMKTSKMHIMYFIIIFFYGCHLFPIYIVLIATVFIIHK